MGDVVARADLTRAQAEQLATAGAFAVFEPDRRKAVWQAGYPGGRSDQLPVVIDTPAPTLPVMTPGEVTAADLYATGIAPDQHPFARLRPALDAHGVRAIAAVTHELDRRRTVVAGHVTHRQRPGTAGGITFLNLEDETGMLNIICTGPVWQRYRRVLRGVNMLVIRGLVEVGDGAINLLADKIAPLTSIIPAAGDTPARSRDFR